MKWKNLFGDEVDEFVDAKERYGVWPTTVWSLNMQSQDIKLLKEIIGDDGTVRARSLGSGNIKKNGQKGKGCYDVTASVFNPAVCAWALNCYAPRAGVCFDPFAGGGTRAIMSAKHGLTYVGVELRQAEVDAILRRAANNDCAGQITIHCGDSQQLGWFDSSSADFSITCPPYYDLEKYKGGPGDLSMLPLYSDFLLGIYQVMVHTFRILKENTTSIWIVGLHRDAEGVLLPMNHDISGMAKMAGFKLKEEIILNTINNGAIQRIGNFDKGNRYLVRTHEYALVFRKGEIASELAPREGAR